MPHLLTSSTASPSTLMAISFPSTFSTRSTEAALEPSVRTIRVTGGEDVVGDVIVTLRAVGITPLHLRVEQPTLDDAFVSLVSDGKAHR